MKNLFLTSFFTMLITVSALAQDFEAPKKGAKIYVEKNTIEVAANQEASFDLYLIKSRAARKSTFEAPKFLASKGLTFTAVQDVADHSHYVVTVKADAIPDGKYSVTVSGKRSGMHTVTGTFMSVIVKPASTLVSKDDE